MQANLMVAYTEVLNHHGYPDRSWIGMVVLSILCHLLFICGVVFLPAWRLPNSYTPQIVEVDLVSLPEGKSRAEKPPEPAPVPPRAEQVKTAEKATAEKLPKRPEPVQPKTMAKPKQAAEKKVSLAPQQIAVKRSIKKKTYNASKTIDRAIAKIEKEAPRSRPRPVLQAIDKLRRKVEDGTGVVMAGGAAKEAMSKKDLELMDIYNIEIWDRIRKNWAFSEEMAQGQTDLEAIINVKIMKDGEIRDIWFETRSGNSYFDDSALKAIKKSKLPPLPEGFLGPYYDVGFRFNPSELQRNR